MTDMILYLIMTALGYIVAAKCRNIREKFFWTGKVQTLAIVFLILVMGMRMGSNEEIIRNLGTIGLSALLITIVIQIFCIIAVGIFRKITGIDRKGYVAGESSAETAKASGSEAEGSGLNSMTFIILICVAIGMALGYLVVKPFYGVAIDDFSVLAGKCIKLGLCVLIFFVGMDLGFEGNILGSIRKAGYRVVLLPFVVIAGSLLGGLAAGTVLGLSAKESLAVAAGMGWYSLAPGIIMEAGFVTASAISFLHNVFREILSILLAPLVAQKVGALEPVGVAGAPAMDVCLPVIERACGPHVVVYSFLSGAIVSIFVPILVTLFIGL